LFLREILKVLYRLMHALWSFHEANGADFVGGKLSLV